MLTRLSILFFLAFSLKGYSALSDTCSILAQGSFGSVDLDLKTEGQDFVLSSTNNSWRAVACDRNNRYNRSRFSKMHTVIDGSKNSVKVRACNGDTIPCLVKINPAGSNADYTETLTIHYTCGPLFSTNIKTECEPIITRSNLTRLRGGLCEIRLPGRQGELASFGFNGKNPIGLLSKALPKKDQTYSLSNSPFGKVEMTIDDEEETCAGDIRFAAYSAGKSPPVAIENNNAKNSLKSGTVK